MNYFLYVKVLISVYPCNFGAKRISLPQFEVNERCATNCATHNTVPRLLQAY